MVTSLGTHTKDCPDDAELLRAMFQGKWRMRVLQEVARGPVRLSELRRSIPECTKKMLIDNLHSLEKLGWIVRTDLGGLVRRVEYRLADRCRDSISRLLREMTARQGVVE